MTGLRRITAALALLLPLLSAQALQEPVPTAPAKKAAQAAAQSMATADAAFCRRELKGMVWSRTELFFGLNRPGGTVSEAQFQRFVDERVTPRFPDGLTLLSGRGQFRAAPGRIEQEGSKLLILLYPYSRARNQHIERIRSEYKHRFDQQSVLRVDSTSCVSF